MSFFSMLMFEGYAQSESFWTDGKDGGYFGSDVIRTTPSQIGNIDMPFKALKHIRISTKMLCINAEDMRGGARIRIVDKTGSLFNDLVRALHAFPLANVIIDGMIGVIGNKTEIWYNNYHKNHDYVAAWVSSVLGHNNFEQLPHDAGYRRQQKEMQKQARWAARAHASSNSWVSSRTRSVSPSSSPSSSPPSSPSSSPLSAADSAISWRWSVSPPPSPPRPLAAPASAPKRRYVSLYSSSIWAIDQGVSGTSTV